MHREERRRSGSGIGGQKGVQVHGEGRTQSRKGTGGQGGAQVVQQDALVGERVDVVHVAAICWRQTVLGARGGVGWGLDA